MLGFSIKNVLGHFLANFFDPVFGLFVTWSTRVFTFAGPRPGYSSDNRFG
jgi:hypothetical protein